MVHYNDSQQSTVNSQQSTVNSQQSTKQYNIAIIGIGYLGLSNAVLLAQHHNVVALDINIKKVEQVNQRISPIEDTEISEYLATKNLSLKATLNRNEAYLNADFIIIATPTDYDENTNEFNTIHVENAIKDALILSPDALIVIKSTIPIGFTEKIKEKYQTKNIIFSPEFLREGRALYDNLYPTRIVVGGGQSPSKKAIQFAKLLQQGAIKKDIPLIFTGNTEAEAIKLFSNAYLAMRVAYFNELDNFSLSYGLNTQDIITGMGADPRIGTHYCNPSFGFGGYCLPKDTKQLKANFKNIPNQLISAIITSNECRKDFISDNILQRKFNVIGIYRLIMKKGSNNFRSSAILDIINKLNVAGKKLIIFEPECTENEFDNIQIEQDLSKFKEKSELIIANYLTNDLLDVKEKVYSRDMFLSDL